MCTCNAAHIPSYDVEIILSGRRAEIVKSHVATIQPYQTVPEVVSAAGPGVVDSYLEFLKRQPGSQAPRFVENVEYATVA
jgi:hypothetical protein